MNLSIKLKNLDFYLIISVFILSVFGIICIGSAIHINLGEDPTDFYMQAVYFIAGIVIMAMITVVDIDYWSRAVKIFYVLNILMLILVLLIGREVNGATRWIRFGPISIQPSEFSKIILIFCMAKFIDKKKDLVDNIIVIFYIVALYLVPIVLIQKQPSLSVSLVILAIMLTQLFIAGLSYKFILKFLAVTIPIGTVCILDVLSEKPLFIDKLLREHQMNRIITFFRPDVMSDSYYQTFKSINAIGSGQLSGKGLYQGTLNQLSYLPEPHNDFIFSVIGEEFGFVGCIFVILVILFIIFRCVIIAMQSKETFHRLIVCGVVGMIAFQTFVNIGVATGIMPNTGMSLPFVSYGGSSMMANLAAIGLVLNIGLKRSKSIFEGV